LRRKKKGDANQAVHAKNIVASMKKEAEDKEDVKVGKRRREAEDVDDSPQEATPKKVSLFPLCHFFNLSLACARSCTSHGPFL